MKKSALSWLLLQLAFSFASPHLFAFPTEPIHWKLINWLISSTVYVEDRRNQCRQLWCMHYVMAQSQSSSWRKTCVFCMGERGNGNEYVPWCVACWAGEAVPSHPPPVVCSEAPLQADHITKKITLDCISHNFQKFLILTLNIFNIIINEYPALITTLTKDYTYIFCQTGGAV